MEKNYQQIVQHYESCFIKHGDSAKGMDWPRESDARLRYSIMLELIKFSEHKHDDRPIELLDFGCGISHLYEYISQIKMPNIKYYGLDLSPVFIKHCKKKFPQNHYFQTDLLKEEWLDKKFDYIVMNGVFTEKLGLSYDEMLLYWQRLLRKVFLLCEQGIAFNVMSSQVDWQREDLFHLPLDEMQTFVCKNLSRHFMIRNDYGLYEYTVYVYKNARNKMEHPNG